ncbi:hypothetical protein D1818_07220 [Aquimarina sp. BL5]|uniref:hypothetical protein n=1 Tax=Aquimarina sp. BL5 TaxID=1714860 RepID=UPI000E4CCA01|nr:hypothetical protein [Aquimarina sp. BL5]AXT50632.1 hypothetical protein D1818_07220 [Aquimarina sp. BL5]RKN07132.1 hypothetical protein D7036_08225 [Aquimarina sp. BL5]
MKKSSINVLFMVVLSMITIAACNKKEKKEYVTNSPSKDTETLIAALTPINSKLPADVLKSCVVDTTDFNSWFKAKSVSKNGIVTPANSVTFKHKNNCDFYKWSEQMFLWMTSPKKEGDYSSGTVIETPAFYTVSPINLVNGTKERTLIPHVSGQMITAVANTQKIDTEEGQATDDVLIAQKNDSILYYITMVNDVYAQFVTGAKAGKLFDNEFPTTQTTLDSITAFAKKQGVTIQDPETLAIEIKTSWVDVTGLSDSDYITMDAIVPNYIKTDTKWTPNTNNPTRTAKLALVGIHIVGSTAGHPEMVWATFEHVNNAPNLSYTYLDNSKPTSKTKTVPADTGNDWLLNDDSASSTYNQSHMKYTDGDIVANTATNPNQKITASNTKMTKPWGVADAGVPNPENASVAASNSQIISTNNSVLGQLANGDMRKNYIFIGATWTNDGAPPTGQSYSVKDTLTASGVAIGTSQLANSTMETYAQHGSAYSQYGSCFSCHSKNDGLLPTDLSHVYQEIMAGIVIEKAKAIKTP